MCPLFVHAALPFAQLNNETTYDRILAYGVSKLCNVLFTRALAQAEAKNKVYVNAAHPGFVQTELLRGVGASYGALMQQMAEFTASLVAYSSADGALTQLYLAASPEVVAKDIRGQYFVPIADAKVPSPFARNNTAVNTLTDWTLATLRKSGYPIDGAAKLQAVMKLQE